ncbi:MAG: hypothetical protein Q9160_001454 [Pyrenula sp. 1 TL-2023]
MYHRHDFEQDVRRRRQRLNRRAAADQLVPRIPKKTTVNVVDVIIDDAENAVAALTLPERPAVVTVGTYGAVTVEPSETQAPDPSPAVPGTALTSSSQSTLSPPPPAPSPSTSQPATTLASGTGASNSASVSTILETTISVIGGNQTTTITSSSDTTTTSTSTSTLELSFVNGTIITVHPSTSQSLSFSSNSTTTRSSTNSSSSTLSSSSRSTSIASTASAGAGGGAIPAPTSDSPSSPTSSSNSPSGGGGGVSTPTVVGSVIGGIAGLALILLLLLFFIRRYRRRLKAQNALPPSSTTDPSSTEPATRSAAMAEVSPRSSGHTPLAAVAPGFLSKWRHSGQTTTSVATSDTGERGFQKLGGRKIASVLTSGGDQYGGNYGAFEKDGASTAPSGRSGPGAGNLSGASFYRDSAGFYGGDGSRPGTPVASSADVPGPSNARDFAETSEGIAVMRPSPARTPVTSAGGIPRQTGSNPSTPRERSREPGARTGPDALGRSLASFDGSRGSKFTEGV